jgi:hypothetical protein
MAPVAARIGGAADLDPAVLAAAAAELRQRAS